MSNDVVRLTFSDGTQLFTVGDGWSVQSDRLHATPEEARSAYDNSENDPLYYSLVPEKDKEEAVRDEEQVIIETTYGSRDHSFREMSAFECKASKTKRLITFGPAHPDMDY